MPAGRERPACYHFLEGKYILRMFHEDILYISSHRARCSARCLLRSSWTVKLQMLTTFCQSTHPSDQTHVCCRITASYHLDLDGSHNLAIQILSRIATEQSVGSLGGTIQQNLEALTKLRSDRQELCRQSVKLECVTAAICVATWTMLAWGSPWVSGLSSCKIRHAQFDGDERIPALIQQSCPSVSSYQLILSYHNYPG